MTAQCARAYGGRLPHTPGSRREVPPDEGRVLRADEDEQADAHQLLGGQQHVLVVPGDGLLQLRGPQLLVRGAAGRAKWDKPSMTLDSSHLYSNF